MDPWYIEQEAARWRGVGPMEWEAMPRAMKARVVAYWQEAMLRETEMHEVAKLRADRESKRTPDRR